jgi:short-subunit dehydrogenase
MRDWLVDMLRQRPWWMNVLLALCLFTTFVYMPWDVFVRPPAADVEVWFGIGLRGMAAKFAAIPHWVIYALGSYGLWRMRSWMWPWAAVYVAEVAWSSFVWSVTQVGGFRGWTSAVFTSAPVALLAVALWNARERFQRRGFGLAARYGGWAVVTGASSGIGAEFARALAREGMDCVLVARREDRLRSLAAELEAKAGVATRVVAADLATEAGVGALVDAVRDLDLGMLVNNAGFGYAGRFDKQDCERLREMVLVNCLAPTLLTSALLPAMIGRGRGAVVVTGSVAGRLPLPYQALYSATKAFDGFLGEALWADLRPLGIDVVVVEPGPVETEFTEKARGIRPVEGVEPAGVVTTALARLGQGPSAVHGWGLWLGSSIARILPRSLILQISRTFAAQETPPEMR